MKNGHNLQIYVKPILIALGFKEEDIKDEKEFKFPKEYPKPDYILKKDNKLIALEIGSLSNKNKIEDLLKIYHKVICITSDEKLPLINCIIYKEKESHEKNIIELKEELEKVKKELEKKNILNEILLKKLYSINDFTKDNTYNGELNKDFTIREITTKNNNLFNNKTDSYYRLISGDSYLDKYSKPL